jgi:aryl-alcohol dehydrogenase-like predicted oxidoreductase
MEALHDVVKSGKVRYLGASSMWAWQFAKMQQVARERGWTRFATMQNHYNLVYREEEREMIPLCRDQGVALLPWSPLARGFLASPREAAGAPLSARAKADDTTRRFYGRDADLHIRESLRALAERKEVSPATLAYAWLLHRGVTAPIAGASKASQVEQAVASLDVQLTREEAQELEAPYEPRPILGHG